MRIPRICVFEELEIGAELLLPTQAGEHLARVLRLDCGHPILLFNGDGREFRAEISQVTKRAVSVRVLELGDALERESPLDLTLAQGVARGEKMDLVLQKATELGIKHIVPLITGRTEVKLDAERMARRMSHWNAVIASACEQSGRVCLPTLDAPTKIGTWASSLHEGDSLRLALDPQGKVSTRTLPAFKSALLVVGPEGGLSDQDLNILAQADFVGLRLGPRILRTETAGLAAITALQAIHGDL